MPKPNHPVERPVRRKGGAKSTKGCTTCKIRRVKCGEERPSCLRCTSTGRHCDGYQDQSREQEWTVVTSVQRAFTLTTLKFQEEREVRSFDFFRLCTASNIQGYFRSALWERLALQAVHEEPAVRHAAIAVAMLDEARCFGQTDLYSTVDISFALREYGKAISGLRKLLSQPDRCSLVAALICSLLCICFEVLEGKHTIALTHLDNALKIINLTYGATIKSPEVTLQGLRPEGYELDSELIQAFARLDVQASSYVCFRPPVLCLPSIAIDQIEFYDIVRARDCLNNELSRMYKFLAHDFRSRPADTVPPPAVTEFHTINQRLATWRKSLEALVDRNASPMTGLADREAKVLLMQHSISSIIAATSLSTKETAYEQFDGAFEEIVYLADDVLRSNHTPDISKDMFSLDMGVIHPLYFTAIKCRSRQVRGRAIELLKLTPGDEGVWAVSMMSQIAQRVKAVEEEGLDELYLGTHRVPEIRRVQAAGFDLKARANRVKLLCGQLLDGPDGQWTDREEWVYW